MRQTARRMLALAWMPPAGTGTVVSQNRPSGPVCLTYGCRENCHRVNDPQPYNAHSGIVGRCYAGTTCWGLWLPSQSGPLCTITREPSARFADIWRPYVGRSSLHLEHRYCSECAYGRTCRPQAPKTRVIIVSRAIRIFLEMVFFCTLPSIMVI